VLVVSTEPRQSYLWILAYYLDLSHRHAAMAAHLGFFLLLGGHPCSCDAQRRPAKPGSRALESGTMHHHPRGARAVGESRERRYREVLGRRDFFFSILLHVGHRCHRDGEKYGVVPNILRDPRSTAELLHGGAAWICNSGVVFSEPELSQTHSNSKN
jgi:hypothetical protein